MLSWIYLMWMYCPTTKIFEIKKYKTDNILPFNSECNKFICHLKEILRKKLWLALLFNRHCYRINVLTWSLVQSPVMSRNLKLTMCSRKVKCKKKQNRQKSGVKNFILNIGKFIWIYLLVLCARQKIVVFIKFSLHDQEEHKVCRYKWPKATYKYVHKIEIKR